jgi:hypothetical protein
VLEPKRAVTSMELYGSNKNTFPIINTLMHGAERYRAVDTSDLQKHPRGQCVWCELHNFGGSE